ncbi:MAG TPA: glycosyltransferase family 39 protein [Candidatus Sulfotelmatobacter sp.]|nr:glycosyltransferase family 39 protein [Candidatus Sulfotelmatobacter sp.]
MNANEYNPAVGTGAAIAQPPAIIAWLRRLARGRAADPLWARPALAASAALAAVLYLVNLTVSGYANTYYAAAALAASKSWSAWFFGSFDAANFITIDKPPLALWVIGLSVRVFGLSSWSVLLPQALAGVATVVLLWLAVRRSFGPAAATIAAVVMALTPAAVLIFRFDNPDAILTLLLVASAWAFLRGLEDGRVRWLVLAGVLVGSAFLTKYLQAYLVLPAFFVTYLLAGRGSVRRRITALVMSGVAVLLASGWWVAIVQAIPAADRPYIGGSTNDSVLDLIFGYDGLGRIFGGAGNPGGTAAAGAGGGAGGGFSGTPGLLRLFNAQLGGQVSWFVPSALVGLVAGLALRLRAPRTDPRRAGYLMWGLWFLVTAATFSLMSGIIHSYYTVALAPAIGALVGGGLVDLWALRRRAWIGGAVLGATIAVTAWWAAQLLGRTPDLVPGADVALLGAALLVAVIVALPWRPALHHLTTAALAIGLAALLVGPVAYAIDTMNTAYSGGDPSAGPAVADSTGGSPTGLGGPNSGALGGPPSGSAPGGFGGSTGGFPGGGPGSTGTGTGAPSGGAPTGAGGGPSGTTADSTLVDYLVANRGSATWIVAVDSSMSAGSIELASGEPVMAMGGFNGSDPAPTLAQFKALVASGQLRFLLVQGNGSGVGPGGSGDSSIQAIDAWAVSVGTVVNTGSSAGGTLYDLSGVNTSGS